MTSHGKSFLERIEVISVPARVRIIDVLTVVGSATATELGRMIPEAKSAMRWHIQRLEEAGFIRHQEGTKPAVWEPDETRMVWAPEDAEDPKAVLALQELERVFTDRRRQMLGEWALERWEKPWAGTPWAEAAISRDYILPAATAEDLEWLDEHVTALLSTFRDRIASHGTEDEATEAVFLTVGAFPWRTGRRRR